MALLQFDLLFLAHLIFVYLFIYIFIMKEERKTGMTLIQFHLFPYAAIIIFFVTSYIHLFCFINLFIYIKGEKKKDMSLLQFHLFSLSHHIFHFPIFYSISAFICMYPSVFPNVEILIFIFIFLERLNFHTPFSNFSFIFFYFTFFFNISFF